MPGNSSKCRLVPPKHRVNKVRGRGLQGARASLPGTKASRQAHAVKGIMSGQAES